MFDLTSMKLLILGLVALIVVGPKDLPVLLRTIGKYVGMIRRQAAEFRTQFDDAMRDQELQTLKAEMEAMKRDVKATVETAGRSLETDVHATTREIDNHIKSSAAEPRVDPASSSDNPHVAIDTPSITTNHSPAAQSPATDGTHINGAASNLPQVEPKVGV
jgi:sec-independent protein translocase protein TatB